MTDRISDEELGRRLAAARSYRGLHQKDIEALASELGHPRGFKVSMVSHMEQARRDRIDRRSVAVLCEIYGFEYRAIVDPTTKLFSKPAGGVVEELQAQQERISEVLAEIAAQVAALRVEKDAGRDADDTSAEPGQQAGPQGD